MAFPDSGVMLLQSFKLICEHLFLLSLHIPCGYFAYLILGLCPADCSLSGPTMDVFGQAAAVNVTVTSSPMALVKGQPYTAGPAVPHPPPQSHSVPVPHSDTR